MVLETGIFGRWLDHKGEALMNKISTCIEETPESSPCEHSEKMAIYEPGSGSLPNTGSDGALVLGLPASRTGAQIAATYNQRDNRIG